MTFNKPFAVGSLYLYSSPTSPSMPDLLFFSPLGIPLTGSVVPNATHTAFIFVETTEPDQLGSLADGTYIVSLLSGASGLSDTSGVPPDASNNPDTADYLYPAGTSVYTTTFTLTRSRPPAASPTVMWRCRCRHSRRGRACPRKCRCRWPR